MPSLAILALSMGLATLASAADVSGSGSTTRYWDCCKGSCSWPDKASVSSPVKNCNINDQPISDANEASGCDGGNAYMCSDQSPWAVNSTFAYGFGAVHIPGGSEASWCCACYELTFTSTAIEGKKMIIQATNTGADLSEGQFDLAIPGGGVGIYNGCTDEWGAPSSGWGAQYGGISSNTCSSFPSALQPGCDFRFGNFFEGADNPTVEYKQVTCPKVLTDKTGCVRDGETPTGGDGGSSQAPSSAPAAPSSAAPASSSAAAETSSYAAPASSSAAGETSSYAAAGSSSAPAGSSAPAPASSSAAGESSSYAAPASSSAPAGYPAPASSGGAVGISSTLIVPPPVSVSSMASSGSGLAPEPSACEIEYVYA